MDKIIGCQLKKYNDLSKLSTGRFEKGRYIIDHPFIRNTNQILDSRL